MKNERIKHKLHKFKVEEPVFKSSIFVFTNVNEKNVSFIEEAAKKHLIANNIDKKYPMISNAIKEGAEALVQQVGHCTAIMCFVDRKPDISTIAHECLHAIYKLLSTKGIELTEEAEDGGAEETYCYFLGFLVKEIWEKTR